MSDRPAARVRATILAAPWAMTPEMVQTLLAIADRDNLSPEAVAAQLGRPLDNTHAVELRDGVAVIPVDGVISRYMSIFSEISGGVSIEALATDLRAALDNPAVSGIVLNIDSPGGEAIGVGEFAAMVRAANERKPIVAYVGGYASSAAYYIASAAGEVVISPDAIVGNIGVIMGVPDPDKRGSRTIDFISSQSPHKRPDPRTEGGRSRLQQTVDDLADVFIAAVAGYRGMTPEAVAAIGGDVLIGQKAIDAGLADRLGSYEGVVAELQAQARAPRRMTSGGRLAAQHREGAMAQESIQKPSWWDGFKAALTGDDSAFVGAGAPAEAGRAAGGQPGTPPPAGAGTRAPIAQASPQPDPEVENLRAEVARMRAAEATRVKEGIAASAAAFAETEIRASRALPAEHDALVGAYTEAAEDDAAYPRDGQPSRVARLQERQATRPAHSLTREVVPIRAGADGTLTLVEGRETTRAEGAAPELTAERWREQRAFTESGKAFLAQHGIPQTGALTAEHRATIARLAEQANLTIAG